jgi:hypothetical protein
MEPKIHQQGNVAFAGMGIKIVGGQRDGVSGEKPMFADAANAARVEPGDGHTIGPHAVGADDDAIVVGAVHCDHDRHFSMIGQPYKGFELHAVDPGDNRQSEHQGSGERLPVGQRPWPGNRKASLVRANRRVGVGLGKRILYVGFPACDKFTMHKISALCLLMSGG